MIAILNTYARSVAMSFDNYLQEKELQHEYRKRDIDDKYSIYSIWVRDEDYYKAMELKRIWEYVEDDKIPEEKV